MDWGYINENPAHGIRLPAREPKAAVFLPTPEQVVQILKLLPEPSYTLMLLLVGTGLRVGEAIGLRWEDIDLNRRNLTVRRDIWHGKVNSPKYAASERVIPLGPILAEHLQSKFGGASPWVFGGNSGNPIDPKNLAHRQLHPVLDRLRIPRFSWHRLTPGPRVDAATLSSLHDKRNRRGMRERARRASDCNGRGTRRRSTASSASASSTTATC